MDLVRHMERKAFLIKDLISKFTCTGAKRERVAIPLYASRAQRIVHQLNSSFTTTQKDTHACMTWIQIQWKGSDVEF